MYLHSGGLLFLGFGYTSMRFFSALIHNLWGLSAGDELKKFLYLAAGAFCLLGSFSSLKPLKESLFINMVGADYYPLVKNISVVLMFLVVMLYSKIVDYVSKQNLIYVFLVFYISLGAVLVALLAHPTLGVANTEARVDRWVAWFFYLFVESYITMMISLFWSFVNDVTSASSAKKGYGMIMFGSQSGAVVFAAVGWALVSNASTYATRVPLLLALSMVLFALLGFFVWRLTCVVPAAALRTQDADKREESVGIWEGLKTVVTRPYVVSIFLLVSFQEVITSLMHFQQAAIAEAVFSKALLTNYYFTMNFALQVLSCSFALFGTSYLHRTIGTRASLISFPLLLLCAGILYLFFPNLYVVTLFLVLLKGLHYAFNQPVRETLYIPTSKDIKYKAKAWIDVVGLRGAKAVGFELATMLGHASATIGIVVVGLLSAWSWMAHRVGKENEAAISKHTVIK